MVARRLPFYCHLLLVAATAAVLTAGCADFKPLDPPRADEMPEGPGILTGERGAFVIGAGGPVDTAPTAQPERPPMTQPPPATASRSIEAPAREDRLPVADSFEPLDSPDTDAEAPSSRRLVLPPLDRPLPPPRRDVDAE